VVQLRWDADVEHRDFQGRLEHLASLRATHFHSIEELIMFISQIVSSLQSEKMEIDKE
jgi:hypothetical protein